MPEKTGRTWRPSPAIVVATIALVAAVGGTTYAQTTINGADIRAKSIAGTKLKNQAVGTAQLRNFAVQTRDIQTGAVNVSKLQRGAVTAPKIARNAVGTAAIAANSVTRADLQVAARIPNVVVAASPNTGVTNGTVNQAVAVCAAGQTLISGGGGITSAPVPGAAIQSSRPEGTPVPNRWQVIMENQSGGTVTFQAFAICATP